ncbi:MAG TPA: hypothetical protein V6D19_04840 [Stenomitos sp.]
MCFIAPTASHLFCRIGTKQHHSIKVWHLETGDLVTVMEGRTNTVTALAFSPVHQLWVSGSHDRTLRLWC